MLENKDGGLAQENTNNKVEKMDRGLLAVDSAPARPTGVNEAVDGHEGSSQNINKSPDSPIRLFLMLIGSFFVIGLVQLLGWAGNGQRDPWVPDLTVLQMTAIIASAIQIVAFVPAFLFQTEKFYDLTGSFTYLTCLAYSFAGGHVQSQRLGLPLDRRAIVATTFVALWAIRLGYFLFTRVLQSKKDGRFDEIKPSFVKFFITWNIQGLWVFLGCLPTFVLNSTQSDTGFAWTDAVGGIMFGVGFMGEVLADEQKKRFNSNPDNKGKWIDVGMWKYSRHPNYFCEWLLQFGLFVLCLAEFQGSQWITVLSPVFVAFLLAFISGVPLLEQRADEKWGGNPSYEEYKMRTSKCLPLPDLHKIRGECLLKCCPSFLV